MPPTTGTDWRQEFGLSGYAPPTFFAGKDDITTVGPAESLAHVLRRAFDAFDLDGVLCSGNFPLIYFQQVHRIDPAKVSQLYRRFWNHGGAPILVLISQDEVHVYSGLVGPVGEADDVTKSTCLVQKMRRVADELRGFLVAVESGEFFRSNTKAFDPERRVDRDLLDNLQATRKLLADASTPRFNSEVLDPLLCRLVFTCYLFDREVIGPKYLAQLGLQGAGHLRDILGSRPRSGAKASLYRLFAKLGEDFNGDLFRDDLKAEAEEVTPDHIRVLDEFFRGTAVRTGQRSFWPYDFGVIPIETISAIYEHFLKAGGPAEQRASGAFYTPRFVAELVLDVALEGTRSLLGKRYLDPACGSGIFLVGLFNRMAEEWKRLHPGAGNDRRAKELMALLRGSLFGVDLKDTACRITAFSLYLAYLDQLSPRDIQELQRKGAALPQLVAANIGCGDFFSDSVSCPDDVHLVVGNPPWGSVAGKGTPAARWCAAHGRPLPDKQIATAFVWKATHHVAADGKVCFVLPHGTLFNHSPTALDFQAVWFTEHAVELVLNLADYQRFLFEEAEHPAVVARYRKAPPADGQQMIKYWAPKADWTVMRAEVITVLPPDRAEFTVRDVLEDLKGEDAPQIWKRHYWATPRDWRLLDRLSLYPRLRDHIRQSREETGDKPWLIAEGFQPLGENDDPAKAEIIRLPSVRFVAASSPNLRLFLLTDDCKELSAPEVAVRSKSNKNTEIYRAPHVLVAKGFTRIAFADFPVSFRHAVRGIHGPKEDRDRLIFLAAYLRSPLARYFLFHTSSNWGVSRQEVHVAELLRLPFPLAGSLPNPERCADLVREVARIVSEAAERAQGDFTDRKEIVRDATAAVEPLVEEYFDVHPLEKVLIEDTVRVTIPSARPTQRRPNVPTIRSATAKQRDEYQQLLCKMLNDWAKHGPFLVGSRAMASDAAGVGLVVLEKVRRGEGANASNGLGPDLLSALDRLRKQVPQAYSSLDLVRGLKVFDRNRLYIVKPLGLRFWTRTAALNDADEIAGTILMRSAGGGE
jgi:hypothetical protein